MGTYLQRANSSPSSQKKFTVSTWVKVCREGGDKYMWSMRTDDSNWIGCRFAVNGCIILQVYTSGSTTGQLQTNAFFRDLSAWYHVVVAVDTTQSTASNRLKLYVNGSQETSFSTTTNPSLNADIPITSNFQVATSPYSSQYSSNSLDGYLAQFIYADNQAYSPSTFGSTNTNGIWIPNSSPSVTYGNNGFKLDFAGTGTAANASGFGADSSGNGNHLASSNLGTNPSTTDTCENTFCTWNPLDVGANLTQVTFSEGNTKAVKSGTTSSNGDQISSSMAFANGKWYMEFKNLNNFDNTFIGIYNDVLQTDSPKPYQDNYAYGFYGASVADGSVNSTQMYLSQEGSQKGYGLSQSGGTAFATNDIMQVAFDADNYRLYIGKNGQWTNLNSSGSTSISGASFNQSTPTGYFEIPTAAAKAGFFKIFFTPAGSSSNYSVQANFGNPAFTIASGNADANGYGNFEYAVPSGYYALCTKNLALYGG